jgi:sugar/nucleoside kinase (ribokinase family)
MIVARGASTAYTVVLSPPGADRTFLHCPGANDSFRAADVTARRLAGCRLLHFGYPPLMRRMYADGGRELAQLLSRARRAGLTTSLDMARPDPRSAAGRADWPRLLARVLPHADFFLPSLDEIRFMLRERSARPADGALLGRLAGRLLDLGAAAVGLKLGADGFYLRTARSAARLAAAGAAAPGARAWLGREMLAPCFRVKVAGTTGAGDCTIAGFLAGLVRGLSPEAAVTAAAAAGACCVERPDATGGIVPWARVQRRIRAGWPRLGVKLALRGWRWDPRRSVWLGPEDRS